MKFSIYKDILPEGQKEIFKIFSSEKWIEDFYLAGGTGLVLQIGHRISVDFDFFTCNALDRNRIKGYIKKQGFFDLLNEDENTLDIILKGVKISFFKIDFKLIKKTVPCKNLHIASILDIALMKLNAISGRGSKKDFIDLYFILKEYFSLEELFENYKEKFGIEVANNYHLLKSLTYFEDAEREPVPEMIKKISWKRVKEDIRKQVKKSGYI